PWVTVVIAFLNGCDRPPEEVKSLAVPGRDDSISHCQAGQGKEPGTIADVVYMRNGDVPDAPVQDYEEVVGIEVTEVGLLFATDAAEEVSQGLNLVIVSNIPVTGQRGGRYGAEL